MSFSHIKYKMQIKFLVILYNYALTLKKMHEQYTRLLAGMPRTTTERVVAKIIKLGFADEPDNATNLSLIENLKTEYTQKSKERKLRYRAKVDKLKLAPVLENVVNQIEATVEQTPTVVEQTPTVVEQTPAVVEQPVAEVKQPVAVEEVKEVKEQPVVKRVNSAIPRNDKCLIHFDFNYCPIILTPYDAATSEAAPEPTTSPMPTTPRGMPMSSVVVAKVAAPVSSGRAMPSSKVSWLAF